MPKQEPMIDQKHRPSPIDFDAKIGDWRVRDLLAVINTYAVEHIKYTPIPEYGKPEHFKPGPEHFKPEFRKPEILKPEGLKPERFKPEKEMLKPEKELFKPEKEGAKPDPGPWEYEQLVSDIVERVFEGLKQRGAIK